VCFYEYFCNVNDVMQFNCSVYRTFQVLILLTIVFIRNKKHEIKHCRSSSMPSKNTQEHSV